ncbi:hypothetical protein CAPTEDRAFT_174752 [Capitella teleta]|uniref:procollagen-proline 4-dioxygenase n=1 Tax=Capitella teleta TaxID=283909 RepID=R7UVX5_CAPTE|nr:hypothetical protein CAPTEDRAFT_174752 [Capitella teleta]|eukprot:ELU10773.1 hypothetical protein CAPTEDRAFT_174752 [Capitella teleta]
MLLQWELVNSEVFSSSANIEMLVAAQDLMMLEMETYVRREESRLAAIKRSLERIRNETHLAPSSSSSLSASRHFSTASYVGHPVNALHIISRWGDVQEQASMGGDLWTVTRRELHTDLSVTLPDSRDFFGSIEALVRLQETYQLPTSELANGVVHGDSADHPMSGFEMYAMGKASLRAGSFGQAVQWLDLAIAAKDGSFSPEDAMADLADAYQLIADYSTAVNVLQLAHENAPGNEAIASKLEDFRRINNTMGSTKAKTAWRRPKLKSTKAYEALCRGEQLKLPDVDSEQQALKCRYKPGILPFVRYKEEMLNRKPHIVLFHDVMSDAEAKTMKMEAMHKLERAHVADNENKHGHSASAKRISQVSWLWDDHANKTIHQLSRRVADITGLQTGVVSGLHSAEPFQILNYGIGGQYEPHVDYFAGNHSHSSLPEHVRASGNRLATFMFYLNDVHAGGATVFPKLKVGIPPTKNGAAFWYNIGLNGDVDPLTEHAGCPVLLGQKWVANKWIHEHGQDQYRTCRAPYS